MVVEISRGAELALLELLLQDEAKADLFVTAIQELPRLHNGHVGLGLLSTCARLAKAAKKASSSKTGPAAMELLNRGLQEVRGLRGGEGTERRGGGKAWRKGQLSSLSVYACVSSRSYH